MPIFRRIHFGPLFLVLLLCLPGFAVAAEPVPLRVHAWVDYFPAWLHEEFTRETGIPIIKSFFADNKTLHRTLVNEGAIMRYDIITPSAEMVQQLMREGLLRPLDRARIPNMADVDPWFFELGYDPGGKYSVPLFWGVLGILVDTRVVAEATAERIKGYKDLWMPELAGKLLLPNDFRSVMSVMLLSLGYSVNDADPAHLEQALDKLESLAPSVRTFDTVDQVQSMAKLTTGVGVVWSRAEYADAAFGGRFRFIMPDEGTPLWIDALAVPASSENPEAAHAFINFVMRPDIAARLGEFSGYAVAGQKAFSLLPESLRENRLVYPPLELRHGFEAELMLPPAAEVFEKRWTRIRLGL